MRESGLHAILTQLHQLLTIVHGPIETLLAKVSQTYRHLLHILLHCLTLALVLVLPSDKVELNLSLA